jgi:hypothetical protein
MSKEKRFTAEIECRHCRNSTPMEVVSDFNDVSDYEEDSPQGRFLAPMSWEAGSIYQLAKCPACDKVTFRRAFWHSGTMDPSEIEYETLYPASDRSDTPRGMPEAVQKAYMSAVKVRSIDANAYGVLLGRVLDIVCRDRKAAGDTLAKKLVDLSAKKEIPERLVEVAKGLRQLRNVGAHPDLGELTEAEVPVLDNLTRAILEYVYTAPILVADAEDCLKRLKRERGGADMSGKTAE